MAATAAVELEPDRVVSFNILPGTLESLRGLLGEGRPLIKSVRGSVTLVSPGRTHETSDRRLSLLILAVCAALRIKILPLGSTYFGTAEDTGYEPDEAYYVQSHGRTTEDQVPDLAVEVVVTNPETKALKAGELLGIPELWVWDVPRRRLTFYLLEGPTGGPRAYRPGGRSEAFPFLTPQDLLDRLGEPADPAAFDAVAFFEASRRWARRVLRPRLLDLRGRDG